MSGSEGFVGKVALDELLEPSLGRFEFVLEAAKLLGLGFDLGWRRKVVVPDFVVVDPKL